MADVAPPSTNATRTDPVRVAFVCPADVTAVRSVEINFSFGS